MEDTKTGGIFSAMGSFETVTLEDRSRIQRYLRLYVGNEASEYTFTNLYIWASDDEIECKEGDGFLLVRWRPEKVSHYLIAFAQEDRLGAALDEGIASARAGGERFSMHSLPEWYCDRIRACQPERFLFEHEPHNDDYIYLAEDLVNLAGKKYQSKRNHINKFMRVYGGRFAYAPYEQSMADDCMEIYAHWFSSQINTKALQTERESVRRALYHAEELGVAGGVILVDGKPEAFSLGELLTEDMAVIHIEKANLEIPELFALINREFAARAFPCVKWINREEDMGDEGLRNAKHSYHPARMIKKYRATLKEDSGNTNDNEGAS
ncbi:MAG: phosphatidylglycerol lysyltransferase domain-containing protein [Peptococcaceae bacterium]|jgi:hypothetical protein|nr:phosphatidylglycerol lysyltransferase domain-containing protein [Peptococcaceae bacterium]